MGIIREIEELKEKYKINPKYVYFEITESALIDNIGNKKMNTIIKSTVSMAKELDMKIIAEGVETKEQVDFLIKHDCNIAQGYYFSKPLDKLSYFELLKKRGNSR